MAWSSNPSEPQGIPQTGWWANPTTPTQSSAPGWFNSRPERQGNFNSGGTLTNTVRQIERVSVTLSGDGSFQPSASSAIQYAAAEFNNFDSSNTGALISGLSAWWYTYSAYPANFSGEGTLTREPFDGLTAMLSGEHYSTADNQDSAGLLQAAIFQMYAVAVDFAGSSILWADMLSSQDGLTASAFIHLAGLYGSVGTLASVLSQIYSPAMVLASIGSLTAIVAAASVPVAAALTSAGALTATTLRKAQRAAALSGAGALTATAVGQKVVSVGFTSSATLTATAVGQKVVSVGFTSSATLTATATGPVGYKGSAAGYQTVTIPTHAVGDIIVIFGYGGTTPPTAGGTVPTWSTIATLNYDEILAYTVATATNHTSGTWTGTYLIAAVLKDQHTSSPIGGNAITAQTNNSPAVAPAVTLSNTSGNSQILHFNFTQAGIYSVSWSAAPTGYTARVSQNPGTGLGWRLLTKNVTTSDGAASQAYTGSGNKYNWTASLEIKPK
jgi:hypothetical protein